MNTDDPDIRAERIASKLLHGDPIKIECPYWADGKHCYAMVWPPKMVKPPSGKRCACGAEVKPR